MRLGKYKIKLKRKTKGVKKGRPDLKKPKKETKAMTDDRGAARAIIDEMIEAPMTTKYCQIAIPEAGLADVKENPHKYIEINIIEKAEVIDSFYIPSNVKNFTYGKPAHKIFYRILEDCLYLIPLKDGRFMLSLIYKEGEKDPVNFKNKNKGITGKAFSLLYDVKLYLQLFYADEMRYNFWIVILLIAGLIAYGVGCYFVFFHNGGMFTAPPAGAGGQNYTFTPAIIGGLFHG